MSTIKPGDAVASEYGHGMVEIVRDGKAWVVLEADRSPAPIPLEQLTRLIPDTGLEDRVREWASRRPKGLGTYREGYASAQIELLALLGAPKAEPDAGLAMPSDRIAPMPPVKPPRGEVTWKLADAMLAARLRGEEE